MRPRTFTDQELLDTARALFLEHGPKLSTSRIAEALGVSQAALFKRFSTKQELMIRALMPQGAPPWIERISDGPDARPVPEQLLQIIREIEEFFGGMMPAIAVLRASGITPESMLEHFPGEPLPCRVHTTMTRFFATLHEQGRATVASPEAAAMAFMGAMHSRHNLQHILGDRAPEVGDDYPERMVELFWSGMKPG